MSIRRKASGRWEARYRDPSGRMRGKTWPTKLEARRFLERIGNDKQTGSWIDPRRGRTTIDEWSKEWMRQRPDLRPRTKELYQGLLDNHILGPLGSTELARLTPAGVRGWHTRLRAKHPSTAAKAYRLLATLMKTAVTDGMIAKSPCQLRGASQEHPTERPVATIAEVDALAEAIAPRLRLLVLLAAWCGFRRGELLALRRSDIDCLHGTVCVQRSAVQLKDGTTLLGPPKTEAGRRTVAIPPHLIPEVKAHLNGFVGSAADASVFTGLNGGPLRPHVLQVNWKRAREKVGRPDLHIHDLRHSGNTWAAATGASTKELMARMGRASSAAAIRYQHATADRDAAIAAALSALREPAKVVSLRKNSADRVE